MNIKQSNTLTNFSRPTGIPNKTNSNTDYTNSTVTNVSAMKSTPSITIRDGTDEVDYHTFGNSTGLLVELSDAENSTEENPIMTAKGWDENGNEFTQTININDIDPENLTVVELEALLIHANKGKPFDPSERSILSTIGYEHGLQRTSGKPIHDMGLHDRFNPIASLETTKDIYSGSPIQDMQDSVDSIIALLDKLSKFGKNGDNNINTISNSVDEVVDDVATSMVDQFSKSSQLKKG